MFELLEFLDSRGNSPFARWFHGLSALAAARVENALSRIQAGNLSDVKAVGQGVFERRIDFGPGYRIYYGRVGRLVIMLLGGGTKARQDEDISRAQERWAEYRRRQEA